MEQDDKAFTSRIGAASIVGAFKSWTVVGCLAAAVANIDIFTIVIDLVWAWIIRAWITCTGLLLAPKYQL